MSIPKILLLGSCEIGTVQLRVLKREFGDNLSLEQYHEPDMAPEEQAAVEKNPNDIGVLAKYWDRIAEDVRRVAEEERVSVIYCRDDGPAIMKMTTRTHETGFQHIIDHWESGGLRLLNSDGTAEPLPAPLAER